MDAVANFKAVVWNTRFYECFINIKRHCIDPLFVISLVPQLLFTCDEQRNLKKS